MPLLFRYLSFQFFRLFFLALLTSIAVALLLRIEGIAQIAYLGTKLRTLLLFTLTQIPYFLPLLLPLSALIAGLLLFQRLSSTRVFTALQTHGISLPTLLSPLLAIGLFLSMSNFFIASELAPRAHVASKEIAHRWSLTNPFVCMQQLQRFQLHDLYFEMELLKGGEAAKNLLLVLPHVASHRLQLVLIRDALYTGTELIGSDVTWVSAQESHLPDAFDHLMIENERRATTSSLDSLRLMEEPSWKLPNDYLTLPLLRLRMADLRQERFENYLLESYFSKALRRAYADLFRRFSLGIAPLSFLFLGCSFGMHHGRMESRRKLLILLPLTAFALFAFSFAKQAGESLSLALLFYLLPHLLMGGASLLQLRRLQ